MNDLSRMEKGQSRSHVTEDPPGSHDVAIELPALLVCHMVYQWFCIDMLGKYGVESSIGAKVWHDSVLYYVSYRSLVESYEFDNIIHDSRR
ncbi:hypothetical protein RRF57_010756 [Xylaria bambusicola]|uniref:Uncharacterized protein n=1 Tax=Xylaria bambusicola TaxID=326684 RepID=A0AAN7V3X7_9PEZI